MSAASLKIRIPEHLPPQQREVLRWIVEGRPIKGGVMMAVKTKRMLTVHGMEHHVGELKRRTGLQTNAELTKLALRIGLTEIDV